MQCPPMPGPGVNFMKPNGFVAAASMTSQTFTPSLSHTIAISFDEPDVHGAERVLEQLHQLRGLGAGHRDDGVDARRVERRRDLGARRRQSADHLRRVLRVPLRVARIDAFRAERQEHVAPQDQALLLEARLQHLPRRSRIRGALQDDQHARMAVARHQLGRRVDEAHVRVARLRQRRGNGDRDRVALPAGGRRRRSPRSARSATCRATSSLGTS